MSELDARLSALAAHLDVPPTPDVAGAVVERLAAEDGQHRARGRGRRRALLVALAAALALAAGLAASPEARSAVLRLLRLEGATVERVERPVTAAESAVADLPQLGQALPLAEARRQAPFPVLVPAALGPPDAVRLATLPELGPVVSLVYDVAPGRPASRLAGVAVLVTEAQADLGPPGLVGKLAGPDTRVERVTVDGEPGLWLEGTPHVVFLRAASGEIVDAMPRLAGNTLLWQRDGLLLRLEAPVERDRALDIARSFR